MSKSYLSTQAQVQAVINKVDAIDVKISPVSLSDVIIGVMDFVNDDITITSGGLDELNRKITT